MRRERITRRRPNLLLFVPLLEADSGLVSDSARWHRCRSQRVWQAFAVLPVPRIRVFSSQSMSGESSCSCINVESSVAVQPSPALPFLHVSLTLEVCNCLGDARFCPGSGFFAELDLTLRLLPGDLSLLGASRLEGSDASRNSSFLRFSTHVDEPSSQRRRCRCLFAS